jgi:hypothetical protein
MTVIPHPRPPRFRNRLEELLMRTDAQRVRLTEQAYERACVELALLRMERATESHRGHIDPEQRALRIRRLQELIGNAVVAHEPPDDGVAEPGVPTGSSPFAGGARRQRIVRPTLPTSGKVTAVFSADDARCRAVADRAQWEAPGSLQDRS